MGFIVDVFHYQVNASVRHLDTWHGRFEKCGTLLQYAVKEEKIDVVQILLQFGCVACNFGSSLFHSFLLRADPNAVTEEEEATPVEIALEKKNPYLIIKLAQYTEISKEMKLDLLGLLLEKNEEDKDDHENFESNLKGLSVSEVGMINPHQILKSFLGSWKTTEWRKHQR